MRRNLPKCTIIIMMLTTFLFGCVNKSDSSTIKTYNIKDGKAEINGICYEINSVTKTTYIYDDNDNIIETVVTNDEFLARTKSLYDENNQLIEQKRYSDDVLSHTIYYEYENDVLIKRIVSKGGLEVVSEYSYGDKVEIITHYNPDGNIGFISSSYLDDDNKLSKIINSTEDGEIENSSTFHYEGDLLVKVIRKGEGIYNTIFNYEYNNVGDKIMEYNIFLYDTFGDGGNTLDAKFYDYEYDNNLLPKTVTTYHVRSSITDEDIRDYQ